MSSIIKPVLGSQLEFGHPLATGLVGLWLFNEGSGNIVQDLSGNGHSGTLIGGSWASGYQKAGGAVVIHTAITDILDFGDSTKIIPTQEISIVMNYRKRDAINRDSFAFSVDSASSNNRCGVTLPFNDGNVYWDFGGTTEDATRETIAGLSFGDDIWVFTSGPSGMEIWQNNVLRSSNTANPIRVATSSPFILGDFSGGTTDSDLFDLGWLYVYNRQLSVSEIALLYREPFIMFERDPIELWVGATSVEVPPVGAAGIMTTNSGFWGPTF